MMSFIQRLAKSLRSARTVELPDDAKAAFYVLMPMVIGNQHKSVLELLANSKFNVNYCCGRAQRTLLHISANCGSYECLCLLIKRGANVDAQDMSGCTPMHLAARNGQKKCLIKLLDSKANVNIRNNEGLTTIHWLAVNGRTELLLDFFRYPIDVDVEDAQGQTALHVACQNGHRAKRLQLCLGGLDLLFSDMTGVMQKGAFGQYEKITKTVECLLEHGADGNRANFNGWTPLHFACSHGQHDTAFYLLSRGATIQQNNTHKTPLDLSVEGGYSETCDILIRHQPTLLPTLIDMVRDVTIKEQMLLKVLSYMCTKDGGGLSQKILTTLADEASNLGHGLLSLSTDVQTHVSSLLRCVKILVRLADHIIHTSSPTSPAAAIELGAIFQPLELLWQLLDDWMVIIQSEIESKEPSRMTKSAPPDLLGITEDLDQTEQTKTDKDEDTESDTAASGTSEKEEQDAVKLDTDRLAECTIRGSPVNEVLLRKVKRLSENCDDMDMIELIMPRICGLIHAFYLVCGTGEEADAQHQHTELSPKFSSFVFNNLPVLKALVGRNPTVVFDHFHFLLECPDLMTDFINVIRSQSFEARRKWFYENLHEDKNVDEMLQSTYNEEDMLVIHRERLFDSSCNELLSRSPDKLKKGLTLRFEGEEGMGEGVVREWFDVLSREILNPDYALFTQSADGSTFQPNSNSAVNPDHLNYFRFAGQCLGLALYHQELLNVYFTRSFYKHILGIPVNYTDVASIDPEYAKNLQWILDHDISDLGLDLTFSVETDVFGVMQEMDLKRGGSKIPVTQINKSEYVQLVTELRMTRAISPQIESFLSGFHLYVPKKLIQMFNEYELELMLSGIPEIDLEDWKVNTTYLDCTEDSNVIKWFWESIEEFPQQDRVLMLQFVTGSSRLPYGGFSKLAGGYGPQKFTISKVPYSTNLLPTASTCVNFLKLPDYPSKEVTKDRLTVALHCGSQGYALA